MSEFNIEVQGGSSVRLPTAGKYCEKDIIVTASGGTEEIENLVDQSGVLDSTDGTATEKVEQLIDKAERDNALYEATKAWTTQYKGLFMRNKSIKKLPRFNYENATTLTNLNYESTVEEVDYYINSSKATSHDGCFERSQLKRMVGVDTSKSENINGMFNGCPVEIIERAFDLSCVLSTKDYSKGFFSANSLIEVRFINECIKWSIMFGSAVLSDESIESILKGLAPVETTQLLSVNIKVLDRILDDKFFDLVSEVIDKGWEIS